MIKNILKMSITLVKPWRLNKLFLMNWRMYANHTDNSNSVQVIALNYWHFIVYISCIDIYPFYFWVHRCSATSVLQLIEVPLPWMSCVRSPSGITSTCSNTFGCCAAQQLSQTMTDGDLSFRLVTISCIQAFGNRRNWQCWYLWCPIFTAAISPLGRDRLVKMPKTLAKFHEMPNKQICVV